MYKILGYIVYRTVLEYYSGDPDEDAYGTYYILNFNSYCLLIRLIFTIVIISMCNNFNIFCCVCFVFYRYEKSMFQRC